MPEPKTGDSARLLVHHFGIDDRAFVLGLLAVALGFAAGIGARPGLAPRFAGARLLSGGLVKLGRNGLPGFVELLARGADGGGVGAFDGLLHFLDRLFDLALVAAGNLVGVVLENLLGAIHGIVRLIAHLDFVAALLVILGVPSRSGHWSRAGSPPPSPVPWGPLAKMCASAGTPAFTRAS